MHRSLVLGCLLAAAWACSRPLAIWIIAGSTVEDLRFGVSLRTADTVAVPVHSVTVAECYVPDTIPDQVYWRLVHRGQGHLLKLREIQYGQAPSRYRSDVGPRPLKRVACFHVSFQASASGYPYANAYFLTDSLGRARGIRGDSLEDLRLPGSQPAPLTDSVRSRIVDADVGSLGRHLRDVLLAHRFSVSAVDSGHLATDVLKLGPDWDDRPVVERIDCGHWPEGGNRVLLPLSRDLAQGYGHLLVSIRARLEARPTTTLVVLDPDVWLNPPWFEQGDRPMMPCQLRPSFVNQLLDEVALRSRGSAAPN